MRNEYYQIAQDCMANIKDEADAIHSYNEMAEHIRDANISEAEKNELLALLGEIVDDELDHIRILKGIFTGDFEVEPDEEPEGDPIGIDPKGDDLDDNG